MTCTHEHTVWDDKGRRCYSCNAPWESFKHEWEAVAAKRRERLITEACRRHLDSLQGVWHEENGRLVLDKPAERWVGKVRAEFWALNKVMP